MDEKEQFGPRLEVTYMLEMWDFKTMNVQRQVPGFGLSTLCVFGDIYSGVYRDGKECSSVVDHSAWNYFSKINLWYTHTTGR